MRRVFVRREVGEREVTHFALGAALLQKTQCIVVGNRSVIQRVLRVAKIHERIQRRHAGTRAAEACECAGVAGDFEQARFVALAPFGECVVEKQRDELRDLSLAGKLLVFVGADSDKLRDQRSRGCEMLRRERHPVRIEVVDGQVAVRLDDDRTRIRCDGARVALVGKPFLDNHGVVVKRLGLAEQITDGDALTRAAHAEKHRVLRRFVSIAADESSDTDEVTRGTVIERLGVREMASECGTERQHIGEVACLRVESAVRIASPREARPALKEELLRGRRQRTFEILCAVHAVDRVLDCSGLRGESFARRVPCADDVFDVKRLRVSVHERCDFLLLFLHRSEQRKPLFTGEITRESVVRLLLAVNLRSRGKRLDIHADRIVEQP